MQNRISIIIILFFLGGGGGGGGAGGLVKWLSIADYRPMSCIMTCILHCQSKGADKLQNRRCVFVGPCADPERNGDTDPFDFPWNWF